MYEDNSFRDEADAEQSRLDDISAPDMSEPSEGLWDRAEDVDLDLSDLDADAEPDVRVDEIWHPNDPHKW